ncbi:toprim domain-containing protein [Prosthecobacter sp.]|uniref:toprim domain-containing protein n=1 Tax=Prosthecobacter sp. TaxID=1965333 RepID=UPI00378326C9
MEVILALGSDVEGEATASYIADILRPVGIAITRLAQSMPAGGGLDHVDELTLYQALHARRKMSRCLLPGRPLQTAPPPSRGLKGRSDSAQGAVAQRQALGFITTVTWVKAAP